MRWRNFFLVSLGVNLAVAIAWLAVAYHHSRRHPAASTATPALVKTNYVVRRQYFSWSEIESTDYPTYIANLRRIGCPKQTIRDIIIADVNALYARKLATDVITPEQQWWRSAPDPEVVREAAAKTRALDQERRALLTRLLGPDWEAGDLANLPRPSHPGVVLDGAVLGVLPPDVKHAVQDVSAHAFDRMQAYIRTQSLAGEAPDPIELAKLRQQTRDELAGILTPPQLEEYLLRYSQNANNLRHALGQLQYFDATPEEFRALFQATDPIDQQLQLLPDNNDPGTVAQRNSLLQQRENAIKSALDPGRYQEYVLLHDPMYRDAYATAQQADDPAAADVLYQIDLATAEQKAAIRANTNLSTAQQTVEFKRAELEQAKAIALALGEQLPPEEAPATTNTPPRPPPIRTHPYTLGAGETAATVANTYGVPLSLIQTVNPGININRLRPGDIIRVPDSLPAQ